MKIALVFVVAILYSWICEWLFGYTSTLYVPVDIQTSPILYQAMLVIYGLCAVLIFASLVAILIVRLRSKQPVKLSVLLGIPLIPISIYGVVNFLEVAPALSDLVLSSGFLVSTSVNVLLAISVLPVLVLLLRSKAH
ncbi:hypothetical protein ACCI51_19345 [Microbulbifer echini]|uniref:Uncharacterized protein n=1 Tax=Microbulbifer echini TaxID=1529067 RepID=A0ABV4NTI6_9GAMM